MKVLFKFLSIELENMVWPGDPGKSHAAVMGKVDTLQALEGCFVVRQGFKLIPAESCRYEFIAQKQCFIEIEFLDIPHQRFIGQECTVYQEIVFLDADGILF